MSLVLYVVMYVFLYLCQVVVAFFMSLFRYVFISLLC